MKNRIRGFIADGDELYYDFVSKAFFKLEKDKKNYSSYLISLENEDIKEDSVDLLKLPVLNLKQEALCFVEKNQNLYKNQYLKFFHKFHDKYEAAWKLLVTIDEENFYSTTFSDFYQYRLEKANILLNQWLKNNADLFFNCYES